MPDSRAFIYAALYRSKFNRDRADRSMQFSRS